MKSTDKGLKRILKAFVYSYSGFISSYKSEIAFRQDILFFIIFSIILFFIPVNHIEKILMFFSLIFIIIMELVNTAIETIIDRISNDYHELSKKAKDIGSCLVLISFINMIFTWILILTKYIK